MLRNAPCSFLGWTILFKYYAHSSIKYSFSPFYFIQPSLLPYISIKNLTAFVLFLMLHHFSGIIYLILFALHSLTCHLEEISKLTYLIKHFYLDWFPYKKSYLTFDCALYTGYPLWTSWLRTSVYCGELATCKSKNVLLLLSM